MNLPQDCIFMISKNKLEKSAYNNDIIAITENIEIFTVVNLVGKIYPTVIYQLKKGFTFLIATCNNSKKTENGNYNFYPQVHNSK